MTNYRRFAILAFVFLWSVVAIAVLAHASWCEDSANFDGSLCYLHHSTFWSVLLAPLLITGAVLDVVTIATRSISFLAGPLILVLAFSRLTKKPTP